MSASRVGQVLVETYRIDRLIAEGGMGSVYEAGHVRLPKRFAVKFLNLNLVDNAEAQARFRREAEIIASLDHSNVVSLFDYNVTDDGVPFIVLEYLDGEHLGRRIARGRLGLAEVLRLLGPVVSALGEAHARNIIHRDLKPENIVLVRGGEKVKVVDFGIAKIRDGQELTGHNMILGTVPYMAPEQLFANAVDARTDQFALATIVYEMLAGEMAFGGSDSLPEIAARVANHEPPYVAGVPRLVNEVVAQGMNKISGARFESVAAFHEAFVAACRESEDADAPLHGADLPLDELPPLEGEATIVSLPPSPLGHPQNTPPPAPAPSDRPLISDGQTGPRGVVVALDRVDGAMDQAPDQRAEPEPLPLPEVPLPPRYAASSEATAILPASQVLGTPQLEPKVSVADPALSMVTPPMAMPPPTLSHAAPTTNITERTEKSALAPLKTAQVNAADLRRGGRPLGPMPPDVTANVKNPDGPARFGGSTLAWVGVGLAVGGVLLAIAWFFFFRR